VQNIVTDYMNEKKEGGEGKGVGVGREEKE